MSTLPPHGRVDCSLCFSVKSVDFDNSRRTEGTWRITWNPLAWGSTTPQVVVLGFSKGPTQAGALATFPHDEIAYKGGRENVGKILAHVGLLQPHSGRMKPEVDRLIATSTGRFHFSSFVRCTVERFDEGVNDWVGTGGGMLDKFMATPFGSEVANRCAHRFLGSLPPRTKLVIMFGLGTTLNYVSAALDVFKVARPGPWRRLNDVAYCDGTLTAVHVEHFASRGTLIPDWLGLRHSPRGRLGELARTSVAEALASA